MNLGGLTELDGGRLQLLGERMPGVLGQVHQDVFELKVEIRKAPECRSRRTHEHLAVVDGVQMLDPVDDALLLTAMLGGDMGGFGWTDDGRHIGRKRHVFLDLCAVVIAYTNHRSAARTLT